MVKGYQPSPTKAVLFNQDYLISTAGSVIDDAAALSMHNSAELTEYGDIFEQFTIDKIVVRYFPVQKGVSAGVIAVNARHDLGGVVTTAAPGSMSGLLEQSDVKPKLVGSASDKHVINVPIQDRKEKYSIAAEIAGANKTEVDIQTYGQYLTASTAYYLRIVEWHVTFM